MRINRNEDRHQTLSMSEGGNEMQLYTLEAGGSITIEVYWLDGNENEWNMTPKENERLPFLEALRDWSNDQIWRLQHEEAAA